MGQHAFDHETNHAKPSAPNITNVPKRPAFDSLAKSLKLSSPYMRSGRSIQSAEAIAGKELLTHQRQTLIRI